VLRRIGRELVVGVAVPGRDTSSTSSRLRDEGLNQVETSSLEPYDRDYEGQCQFLVFVQSALLRKYPCLRSRESEFRSVA